MLPNVVTAQCPAWLARSEVPTTGQRKIIQTTEKELVAAQRQREGNHTNVNGGKCLIEGIVYKCEGRRKGETTNKW